VLQIRTPSRTVHLQTGSSWLLREAAVLSAIYYPVKKKKALNAHNILRNETFEPDGAKEGKTGCKKYEKKQHVKWRCA